MSNQLYGGFNNYNYIISSSSSGGGAAANISRSVTESYLPSDPSLILRYSSRYRLDSSSDPPPSSSSMLFSLADGGYSSAATQLSWPGPPGVDVAVASATAAALKRPASEALYHQTLMGARNTIGQTEAWFSTNPLAKRSRLESASNLPIYPQRPGEKDCAHYMLTRTCKFGDSCKFDHPIWVPEGGIPDWKEVPQITTSELLPERPGEADCPYFLKTQRCKFGARCKFNHPKDKISPSGAQENIDVATLPERPFEPPCAFYMKTGKCKFGATCKYHHPKDIQIPPTGQENNRVEETVLSDNETDGDLKPVKSLFTPALMHNSKGLPIRLGEVDCPFYLKTGSCKYGTTCRYNHPDRSTINPPAAAIGAALVASPTQHLNIGVVNPAASILQTFDPRLTQTTLQLGFTPDIYPQRPGEIECDFYMKTGECKFGQRCKFHHPIDRSVPMASVKEAHQQNVKLTLAGLPRREGAIHCPYYMKTGTCKYGATCKFDHPPPAEVMALATSQGTLGATGGQGKEDEEGPETSKEQQQ